MNSFTLSPMAVEVLVHLLRSVPDEQPASAPKPVLMLPTNGKGMSHLLTVKVPDRND